MQCQCCAAWIAPDELAYGIQEIDLCAWCYERCDEHHYNHDADIAAKDDNRQEEEAAYGSD